MSEGEKNEVIKSVPGQVKTHVHGQVSRFGPPLEVCWLPLIHLQVLVVCCVEGGRWWREGHLACSVCSQGWVGHCQNEVETNLRSQESR